MIPSGDNGLNAIRAPTSVVLTLLAAGARTPVGIHFQVAALVIARSQIDRSPPG